MKLTVNNYCATITGASNIAIDDKIKVTMRSNGSGNKIGSLACVHVMGGAIKITYHDNGNLELQSVNPDSEVEGEVDVLPQMRRISNGLFRKDSSEVIVSTYKQYILFGQNVSDPTTIMIL